jgi:5-methylcytosine-specific restriction endonuclease McrA
VDGLIGLDNTSDAWYHYLMTEYRREKMKEYKKTYYRRHKKDILLKNKEYRKLHSAHFNEIQRESRKLRRKIDIGYVLSERLRSRFLKAIKATGASKRCLHVLEMTGCTIEFLVQHLEKTCPDGMKFSECHIDHIRPVSSFDLTDIEQVKECWNYKNLQLLSPSDNHKKSNKIILA